MVKQCIVIPTDTNDLTGGNLRKPGVHIFQRRLFLLSDIAEVTAMHQQVTLRDGQIPGRFAVSCG